MYGKYESILYNQIYVLTTAIFEYQPLIFKIILCSIFIYYTYIACIVYLCIIITNAYFKAKSIFIKIIPMI